MTLPVAVVLPLMVTPNCPVLMIVMLPGESAVNGVPVESWTWTLKVDVPVAVGVPEMVQVLPLVPTFNPAGRLPELIEQV